MEKNCQFEYKNRWSIDLVFVCILHLCLHQLNHHSVKQEIEMILIFSNEEMTNTGSKSEKN